MRYGDVDAGFGDIATHWLTWWTWRYGPDGWKLDPGSPMGDAPQEVPDISAEPSTDIRRRFLAANVANARVRGEPAIYYILQTAQWNGATWAIVATWQSW